MASRNNSNQSNQSAKQSRHMTRAKRAHDQQIKSGCSSDIQTKTIDDILSRNSNHSNGFRAQPTIANFSSRNSLRTANNLTQSKTMTPHIVPYGGINYDEVMLVKDIDPSENYISLYTDCFIETMGDFIICMLCGKKERMREVKEVKEVREVREVKEVNEFEQVNQVKEKCIERHLESHLHNTNFCRLRSSLIDQTPGETSIQMNALRELTNSWYFKQALTDDEFVQRLSIIEEFKSILERVDAGCTLRDVGSLKTRTSLKKSDINLELIHPNSELFETDARAKSSIHHKLVNPDADFGDQINQHTLHYDLIPNAIDTLYKLMKALRNKYREPPLDSFDLISVLDDLNKKVPKLILKHLESSTILEVNCYAESSHELSKLLSIYMSLDERARILSIIVKYWADICEINDPNRGTYPPDTFVILVIYYLQRTSPPILPCLHEIISKNSRSDVATSSESDILLTEKFEKLKLQQNKRDRNDSIVDESLNLESGIEPEDDEPDDGEEDDRTHIDFLHEDVKNLNWCSDNNSTIHILFIDFLKFMMNEFDNFNNVITIRTLKNVTLAGKVWGGTKIKGIENPVKPRSNLSRCIGTCRTFEYIKNCFKQGYYYLTSIPLDHRLKMKEENQPHPQDFIELYVNINRLKGYYIMKERAIRSGTKDYDPITEMINQKLFDRDVEVINQLFERNEHQNVKAFSTTLANSFNPRLLKPDDVAATRFCRLCRSNGHSRLNCSRAKIETLHAQKYNYDSKLDFVANLDNQLLNFYHQDSITEELSRDHNRIVHDLTELINSATDFRCVLELFGSTVNNLGSYDSDLDICLTLEDNPTGRGVDCVKVLQVITEVLMDNTDNIDKIEPILSARVPIIKFRYHDTTKPKLRPKNYDIDLSMYNQCAIFNSKLLKTYASIDERLPQLFYLVKRYAKACGIADASRGSLSSYAWSLMVIHYLQRTSPPILPVLQETTSRKPVIGVNGWNVWFNQDIKSLRMKPNTMSLTQLFKGFFLYFGTFDFKHYVVSIRKLNLISRFQKNWNNCMMAIEDPFELTYNLASRLDDAMSIFIINSFAQAYKHVERIQKNRIDKNGSVILTAQRLFNYKDITGSSPPYRGCKFCHRIGHKTRECTSKHIRIR